MNPADAATDQPRLAPRRRGFRARVHGLDGAGASAFSQRALLASLALHAVLLGAFGLTSALARSSGSPASSSTLLFARAEDLADAESDPVYAQPADGEPAAEDLVGELWEPELVEARELEETPSDEHFAAQPVSTEDDWPLAAAFERAPFEVDSEESTNGEPLVVDEPEASEALAAEELDDAEAPTAETEHENAPTLISAPPPAYPRLAVRMGWEGSVYCRVQVATDGSVESASVDTSSGYEVLDQAAVEAIRQWRFEPRPTPLDFVHQVTFRLER